jgi:hypothetical protein
MMMLLAGFWGALGLVTIVLWNQGILREAFYYTITVHAIPHVFWADGFLNTLAFVGACLPLILGTAMACRDSDGVWANKHAERAALLGLVVTSAIGAVAGARFFLHYYIQLIPPLALLAAPHFARLWSGRTKPGYWFLRPVVIYAWLAITVVAFSISHWLGLSCRRERSETARYLLKHSAPDDRIFVWGSKARFYSEAQRAPACRYVMTYWLTGPNYKAPGFDRWNFVVPDSWTNLERDFARHPPIYILDIQWDFHQSPHETPRMQEFPILAKLLAERYELVAQTAEGVVYRMRDGLP